MSIAYATPNRNDLYIAVTTRQAAVANINTSLVAAGWSSTPVNANAAILNLVPGPGPSDGQTVVTDTGAIFGPAKTYTFRTVINNAVPGEVLIGVTVNDSFTNLKKAINLESGAGTNYSSATTANLAVRVPSSPASITSNSIGIEQITAGYSAGIVCTTNGSNWVWNTTLVGGAVTLLSGGYKLLSQVTPEFQQFMIYVYDQNETNTKIRMKVSNAAETELSHGAGGGFALFGDATFDERVICDPYQCFAMVDGISTANPGRFFCAGVPQIPPFMKGIEVTGATNASPIVITTSSAHGLSTGNLVTIRRVLGNTAANVTNQAVTVISPTTFSVPVAGNGAFTGNGVMAYVGPDPTRRQICEAIWAQGGANNAADFRANLGVCGDVFCALNGSYFTGFGGSGGSGNLQIPGLTWPNFSNTPVQWFNTSNYTFAPLVAFGTSLVSNAWLIGQLWNAAVVMASLPPDLAGGGPYDGHNWWAITANNAGSIALAPGTLQIVVP